MYSLLSKNFTSLGTVGSDKSPWFSPPEIACRYKAVSGATVLAIASIISPPIALDKVVSFVNIPLKF